MTMKKLALLLAVFVYCSSLNAQISDKAFENNKAYTGARADKKKYRAIYQLDNSDPKIIEKAIRNLNNALTDPRLAGKIQIELIAFAGGTEAYMKGGKFEEELKALVEKGVIVAQCNNTLRERKISRDQLYDFIAVVPSGNGELIIRAAEGWTIIKP
jgi:intracellular sulfur oxidation DsrE/DsrF family protein